MDNKKAFENFAPTILRAYRRDKEAFWAAVMAPFLSNKFSLLDWWHHLRVDVDLLSAFRGMDGDALQALKEFSVPFGFDVSTWKSNRIQYFKDAYPVFAFLAVWMDEEGLSDYIARFAEILQAGVYAVAGYGILDVNVDSDDPSPVEILTAQALLAEYETLALKIFGITQANLEIMHKMRSLFLAAEIKEKSLRHKASPYRLDHPEELGTKGANSVAPFMLSLEHLGRSAQIDDYWQVFLLFGAAIQMIDDWNDLESDLAAGHFSYVTLGREKMLDLQDTKRTARLLREDKAQVQATYDRSREMITQARAILARLDDHYLVRLVDVTEHRLESYFHKELKLP